MNYNRIQNIVKDQELNSLDAIRRWVLVPTSKCENLSEHSFWVAFYTNFFFDTMFTGYEDDNEFLKFKLDCIQYALVHDVDEIFSGDVPHQVKNNSVNGKELRRCLEEFTKISLDNKFKELGLSGTLKSMNTIKPAVKYLVKVADWMSFLKVLYFEISMGNKNPIVLQTLEYCEQGLKDSIHNLEQSFLFDKNSAKYYI